MKITNIENIKEFITRTKSSKSSIYRFYRKNTELFRETYFKKNKRYFPIDHAKYFDSEVMFDENKLLRLENQSMRNLIDYLADKDSFQTDLWYMEWSFFMAVAYKAERSKISCYKMMHGLYDRLVTKYGELTEIRLFFTTEPFPNRVGYHNHFVLYISKKALHEEISEEIRDYFFYDRVDSKIYDKYKAGLFYAVKKGLINEDWDILGNNLKKDNQNQIAV